jgi:hypothetical protein
MARAQNAPQRGMQTQLLRDIRLVECVTLACVRQLPRGLVFAMGA